MSYNPEDYMETLEKDLSAWKNFESHFTAFGSAQDLKDRKFKKMKLAEMDRLWYKWKHAKSDPDLRIVAYHRSKLEASLYPGLTGWLYRMARRAAVRLWHELVGHKEQNTLVNSFSVDDLPGKDKSPDQHLRQTSLEKGQGKDQKKSQGWDYGAKKEIKPGHGLGR